VANTILKQLGGAGRLKAMVGAKDFVGDKNALTFKHMKSAKGTFAVRITLLPDDTYEMQFYGWPYRGRGGIPEVKTTVSGLHSGDLIHAFEGYTGLALGL
jgi:hypothetical protein